MNYWAQWLADVPPTLQRAIARYQRVSVPRGADAAVRVLRLRAALCHARTVRVTYFSLPVAVQHAVQSLCQQSRRFTRAELVARFGALRVFDELLRDPAPRTVSEHLVLLGWLLPRPASPCHPARFRFAPTVRAWVPRPLVLPDAGAAPPPSAPPIVRAATTLLLAAADTPLALRADRTLRAAAVRLLLPRLAPLPDAAALLQFTVVLLADQGLLAPHGAAAAISPAGRRFLALSPVIQRAQLHHAWLRAPRCDAWVRPLLETMAGLDMSTLRRRLCAWTAALPIDRCLDPAALYPALVAALGPLADGYTHAWQTVTRAPWQPRRAAAVWQAALCGPLAWLGLVAWTPSGHCCVTVLAQQDAAAEPLPAPASPPVVSRWCYGADQTIYVSHAAPSSAVLRLLPYVVWHAADAEGTTYRMTTRSLARAASQGFSIDALWALLAQQGGAVPQAWRDTIDIPSTRLHLRHAAVLVADDPATMRRVARQRNVRRYLAAQLAPGVALVDAAHAVPLARALARQDVPLAVDDAPPQPPPAHLSVAECAALLHACAAARQHAPSAALPLALNGLEARLRAALPPELRRQTDAAIREHAERSAAEPATAPHGVEPPPATRAADQATTVRQLTTAITRRQTVQITYTDRANATTTRVIRPLRLEWHGDHAVFHAYCSMQQDERCFRIDRITSLTVLHQRARRGPGSGRVGRPPETHAQISDPAPLVSSTAPKRRVRKSSFTAPPTATGNPLVRVWLEEVSG